jgi:hypothetical protein
MQPPAQTRRSNSIRFASTFLVILAVLLVPTVLPTFSRHRFAWLHFLSVVALISVVFPISFKWLEQRKTVVTNTWVGNRLLRATVELIVCCIVAVILFQLIALHNDIILLLAVIPTLLAVWFAYTNWRILFRAIADTLHWSPFTCSVIGVSVLAVGFALQHLINPHRGFFVMFV